MTLLLRLLLVGTFLCLKMATDHATAAGERHGLTSGSDGSVRNTNDGVNASAGQQRKLQAESPRSSRLKRFRDSLRKVHNTSLAQQNTSLAQASPEVKDLRQRAQAKLAEATKRRQGPAENDPGFLDPRPSNDESGAGSNSARQYEPYLRGSHRVVEDGAASSDEDRANGVSEPGNNFTQELATANIPYGNECCFNYPALDPSSHPRHRKGLCYVSDKYKFVFILIPKAGSSTSRSLAQRYGGKPTSYAQLSEKQMAYFTFAFVRDPVSRLESAYTTILNRARNDCKTYEHFAGGSSLRPNSTLTQELCKDMYEHSISCCCFFTWIFVSELVRKTYDKMPLLFEGTTLQTASTIS